MVFILHQSMDGPWPGPEPGSGQGKAAALESLDGIKIRRPRKKSEALSRRTTQSHPSSRRPSLAHLGPRSLTGLWTLAGELGRSLHRGLARANPEPEKIRGKEWCSVTSVYSVKEGVTGSLASWPRRRLPWRIFQGGARRRSHSRCWRWPAPSPAREKKLEKVVSAGGENIHK